MHDTRLQSLFIKIREINNFLWTTPFSTYVSIGYFFMVHFQKIVEELLRPILQVKEEEEEPEKDCYLKIFSLYAKPNTTIPLFTAFPYFQKEDIVYDAETIEVEVTEKTIDIVVNTQYDMFWKDDNKSRGYSLESLFIVKNIDKYIIRRKEQNDEYDTDKEIPNILKKLETVPFLYVEYTHPMLQNPVEIELDAAYYIVGNELFSAAFLSWFLEKSNMYYVFDYDYKLKIVDLNMNELTLNSNDYIKIIETGYEIFMDDNEEANKVNENLEENDCEYLDENNECIYSRSTKSESEDEESEVEDSENSCSSKTGNFSENEL